MHELRITNQVIYLNPPIEDCRYKLYQEMFAWKMVILSLPRIQSQRYQVWRPCRALLYVSFFSRLVLNSMLSPS